MKQKELEKFVLQISDDLSKLKREHNTLLKRVDNFGIAPLNPFEEGQIVWFGSQRARIIECSFRMALIELHQWNPNYPGGGRWEDYRDARRMPVLIETLSAEKPCGLKS